jgi:exodeoxyribonuclease-3
MGKKFVIATWNVNSVRARIEHVIGWLKKHKPDVLCLQETKVVDEIFPVEPFSKIGYNVVFRGQKAYNGVAIVSLEKAKKVSYGLDGKKDRDESRLIRAKIGPVEIVNTYVPQGRDIESEYYQYKLKWFRRLKSFFAKYYTPRKRLVWLGDINVAPTPIDVHNPGRQSEHVCYHEDARKAFESVLTWGFTDVFRKHRPEPGMYSFYDYRAASFRNNKGWRIDHILATKAVAAKSVNAAIDIEPRKAERPSDHTVMSAEFRF